MRTASIDFTGVTTAECSASKSTGFADTLAATLQRDDSATPTDLVIAEDEAATTDGDLSAAAALLGSLVSPLCAPPITAALPTRPAMPSVIGEPFGDRDGAPPDAVPVGADPLPLPVGAPPPLAAPPFDELTTGVICINEGIVDATAPTPAQPAHTTTPGDAQLPVNPVPPPPAPPPRPAAAPPPFATVFAPAPGAPPPSITGDESSKPPPVDLAHVGTPRDRTGSDSIDQSLTMPVITAATNAVGAHAVRDAADELSTGAIDSTMPSIVAPAVSAGRPNQVARDAEATARTVSELSAVVCDLVDQARASSPRRVVVPLDPPALGHVTVEIIVRADSVKVSLQHGDDAAFAALTAQRPAIEAALESNGLHLSGFDVSSNHRRQTPEPRRSQRFETFVDHVEPDGALRL